MCIPWEGTRFLPKAALLFLDSSSLVSASPPFPDQQLSEPAPWNSGKAMEAEWGPFPKNKKWGTQKGFCAQEPHRALLGYSIRAHNSHTSYAFLLRKGKMMCVKLNFRQRRKGAKYKITLYFFFLNGKYQAFYFHLSPDSRPQLLLLYLDHEIPFSEIVIKFRLFSWQALMSLLDKLPKVSPKYGPNRVYHSWEREAHSQSQDRRCMWHFRTSSCNICPTTKPLRSYLQVRARGKVKARINKPDLADDFEFDANQSSGTESHLT